MPTEDWKYQISLELPEGISDATLSALYDIIEAALKERDERAAKIVNDARFEGGHDLRSLAHRIRNEES